jgi:hypothetical protein
MIEQRGNTLIVSGGGLCPSNRGAGFPNLAREQNPPEEVIAEVTATAVAELEAAGINTHTLKGIHQGSEVPSDAFGSLSMWGFRRAWYYWMCEGPGLPVEVAEKLHAAHGTKVRVDGNCNCPAPREWFKGFGVGRYHVDSPEGLKALADAIRSVYDASKDPDATPRSGKET